MIALDANVLVRLLTRDDETQAEKVRSLFENSEGEDSAFFVSNVVLADLAWTLERAYEYDRASISLVFSALIGNATLTFESREMVRAALSMFSAASKAGFADCLIVVIAKAESCSALLTLDKKMSLLPDVQLL